MSAPAQVAPFPEFTLEQALIQLERATQNDHDVALPIFLLLKIVADPNGDSTKYGIADEVMKRAILMTPQFEEWYRSLVA